MKGKTWDVVVIGGGAAGFFAAINAKIFNPSLEIVILEQSKQVLNKVRISGGGRCNVTHACFDAKLLTSYYPRGEKELLGPFHVFNASHTVEWFEHQGIKLYTQDDGCMFPVSNSSVTIIDCFLNLARKHNIQIITQQKAKDIQYHAKDAKDFTVVTESEAYTSRMVMLATGSSPFVWNMMEKMGYQIVPPCPSLFTFNLPKHPISQYMGLVVENASVRIEGTKIETSGPLLITHWGLSGPAVLKASAWGATILAEKNYEFTTRVNWMPDYHVEDIKDLVHSMGKKKVVSNARFGIPSRLWHYLTATVLSDKEKNWASLNKKELADIIIQLTDCPFKVRGKTTFKEEFVTAGGIALEQIQFKSFQSKLHPGLFIAGEALNIDAVTGGFNFQAAWTGGYLAAMGMADF